MARVRAFFSAKYFHVIYPIDELAAPSGESAFLFLEGGLFSLHTSTARDQPSHNCVRALSDLVPSLELLCPITIDVHLPSLRRFLRMDYAIESRYVSLVALRKILF